MLTCWETFILRCAEQSQCESAIDALSKLQETLAEGEKDRFHKLVNFLLTSVTTKEYFPYFTIMIAHYHSFILRCALNSLIKWEQLF